jgi:hypothetical protein
LARIAGNGVRTIIVETANRFARDLMVQGVGFAMLRDLGITLIAADSPSSFLDDGPTSKLIRQILGAVSEFDKAMTVAKLKGARDRVRRQRGKCEGRKSYAEREGGAELVAMARQLHTNPHGRSPCSARRRRFGGSRVRHTNRPPIFRLCRCLDAHSRVTRGALPCHGRSVVCYNGKRRPRAALSHDRPR